MQRQATSSKVPTGPALIRRGVVGILGAGLGAIACGGRTESTGVPPTTGTPTATPQEDAGGTRDAVSDGARRDAGEDATFSLGRDSGFMMGVFDATGRDAADALADAASDGSIFEPPCGKKAPPLR